MNGCGKISMEYLVRSSNVHINNKGKIEFNLPYDQVEKILYNNSYAHYLLLLYGEYCHVNDTTGEVTINITR